MPVLLFALAVSIATGLLFGLAPVGQRRVRDLVAVLKDGGDRGASGGGRHQIRRALVMGEVALAMMLVIGAALLLRTRLQPRARRCGLRSIAPGHVFDDVATGDVSEASGRAQVYQRLLDTLAPHQACRP